MRLQTLIELRRHFRAIDLALKQEIDEEKSAGLAKTIDEALETTVGKQLLKQTRQVVDRKPMSES